MPYFIVGESEMAKNQRCKAIEPGATRYFGKPCRRCGGTERYTANSGCVVCCSAATEKYRAVYREIRNKIRGA